MENAVRPMFLFSLPRSGSTLLQRILGRHPDVATAAEAWLLLPLLYAMRPAGVFAEYGHAHSATAIRHFVEQLPGGADDYHEALRDFALRLYAAAAAPPARFFLDKTPRYSLVASDVLSLFPDAPAIVLWRNPLAIVASIVDTWLGGRWQPYHHKVDLYLGLERLLGAYAAAPDRFVAVRYEALVAQPEAEAERLFKALGLSPAPDATRTFAEVDVSGPVGDTAGVARYREVSSASLERWRVTLSSPVRRRWAQRYLDWIGRERLALMGYDLDALLEQLDGASDSADGARPAATVLSDVAMTARGIGWSVLEPQITRAKMKALPRWREIIGHT